MPGPIALFRAPRRFKGLGWLLGSLPVLLRVPEPLLYQRGASSLTAAAWLAARLRKKRFVWAVASDVDCDAAAAHRRAAGGSHANPVRLAWGYALSRLVDRAICGADVILYQHEGQRAMLLAGRRVRPERLTLLRNAVQPAEKPPLTRGERHRVAWVGSIRPGKHPELFLDVAAASRVSAEFVMAGRLYPPSAGLFADGAPTHGVKWAGELAHLEVMELLRQARVLVSTSEVEGFPNTWLEAWTAGTPVASLSLDPGDVLRVHGCGWVANTPEELAAAVRRACSDDTAWDAASQACREYVQSAHATEVIGAQLEAILRA
jgi:glycosyltransferase involved in cell wall biosynthesis